MDIDIGISKKDRKTIAEGLSKLLADTYTLYLKTHNFHWNVEGPMFNTLHAMFMQQYTELWNAVDPIAERIRSLGHPAPGSYSQFGSLASIPDAPATAPKAMEMVKILVDGHEAEVWLWKCVAAARATKDVSNEIRALGLIATLALSASSPFWKGADTGLASARSKVFESLPTAGLPYQLSGWKQFEAYMETLITTHAIESVREVWWDIRPHPDFGTVELRICDGLPTLDEIGAVAALLAVALLSSPTP